jgi:hypothetical protein
MKNLSSKLIITVIVFAGFVSACLAQFEGSIEFRKMTTTDTTKYIYYVKGNKIRIDEIGSKSKKLEGSFLIDLTASTMIDVNHDRKLYMDQKPSSPAVVGGKPELSNTKMTKTLLGVPCKELVVTNKDDNATIHYYIAPGKFDFFVKMLKLINRKDKQSSYYLLLKEAGDGFPYLSIQTDNTGKEFSRLEVLKIEKKPIEPSVFEIPKEYQKFEKN